MIEVTNEQQYAADKVREAALLLQLQMRRAAKAGVKFSANIFLYEEPRVSVSCFLSEERELTNTEPPAGGKK